MALKTNLADKRVDKDEPVIEVLGCLDESSVVLGSAKLKADNEIKKILTRVQEDFNLFSAVIAGCKNDNLKGRLEWLEEQIEYFERQIDIPDKFVLPGRSELQIRLNLARVIVRKTERRLISLNRYQQLPSEILDYFNRLSWFLFLSALL